MTSTLITLRSSSQSHMSQCHNSDNTPDGPVHSLDTMHSLLCVSVSVSGVYLAFRVFCGAVPCLRCGFALCLLIRQSAIDGESGHTHEGALSLVLQSVTCGGHVSSAIC